MIIRSEDNLPRLVNAILETGYNKDFCVSRDFDPDFIARLMKAGFLVMSSKILDPEVEDDADCFVLLPKLHLTRSILFFDNLHIKKSIKRHLNRFELRPDTDFDYILDRCIEVHGDDWLTPPLVAAIRNIRQNRLQGVYPTSFALYQNGKPVAGEFGVRCGRVYTSYSGYCDESNAGTVQLILATRYLREHDFAFFDLGMPLDYKTNLGAVDLSPQEFVKHFRASQE
ncbi:MAG: GNAT family N-acetyltransferase [Treponema sp.]|nr:GNAT family N-acetyltransferase [Treponema sp.]